MYLMVISPFIHLLLHQLSGSQPWSSVLLSPDPQGPDQQEQQLVIRLLQNFTGNVQELLVSGSLRTTKDREPLRLRPGLRTSAAAGGHGVKGEWV